MVLQHPASTSLVRAGVLISLLLATLPPPTSGLSCEKLEADLLPSVEDSVTSAYQNATVRRVDLTEGHDTSACLNPGNQPDPPPCVTLPYALYGTAVPENQEPQERITIYIGPGIYTPTNNSAFAVINSRQIAVIGSGRDQTWLECGTFGDNDSPCSYMNFQIRNSSNVYVTGVTFTRCGPITSAVYVAHSEHVVFADCDFRDNLSPPLLIYNTAPVILNRTHFLNNRPQQLNETITGSTCYFSGGIDVFFLDNRTSSGGVSHYSEGEPMQLYIVDCLFEDNLARPDEAVSLPRESDGYGHGGALNLRLSNSSNGMLCIKNSVFKNNTAEAQAGALALTIGGFSSENNVELSNCSFMNNSCYLARCTGGAVGIDFFFNTSFNEVVFKETDFIGNSAETGGAISLSTTVGIVTAINGRSDALILKDCLFEENKAFFEGTALGVFSLTHTDQIGLPVNITDCIFTNNAGTHDSSDTTALTAYRVLMTFLGNSSFLSNEGGGITLLGSRMDILGQVTLDRNFAVFGAGIAMSGRSLLLLYEGAVLQFTNNVAVDQGAGMYVEYTSSDFVLAVLNRGCFIQYFTTFIDIPPNQWKARVEFINNTAGIAGAAIYANDMSRCKWLGPTEYSQDYFIFDTPSDYDSPFVLQNNTVQISVVNNTALATDASTFRAEPESLVVGFGERVSYRLFSTDQFQNFRETVWSVNAPLEMQPLGALSSNGRVFEYEVPDQTALQQEGGVRVEGENANITVEFSLLDSQASPTVVKLQVQGCHPGYKLDQDSHTCVCDHSNSIIVQCDVHKRYFYAREGYWIGVTDESSLIYSTTVPGFLNCTRQGALPGCEIEFDHLDEQCAPGREGTLCGDCRDGFGVTFDLRFCRHCGAGGIVLFVFICLLTVFLALLILYFDFPLPDELKGFIFFAQVIGVIYRNTPYLLGNSGGGYEFFDILINLLGFSLPFQLCPMENFPAIGIALLGFVPPVLATSVAIAYICLVRRSKYLSKRSSFNGFHFLYLFVYKYFLDTSFIFINCTLLDHEYVFTYQGTLQCFKFPFILLFTIGFIFIILLGLVLPSYLLYLVYRPQSHVQAADAITRGLKDKRRYRWYGVWDIWRRILFVAANLFISITTRNVVLLIHCLLIAICLAIVCFVKPYKKAHNNISEAIILLCLFGATLAILDDNDVHVGARTGVAFAVIPFIYSVLYILYVVGRTLSHYLWMKGHQTSRWKLDSKMAAMYCRYRRMMDSKLVNTVMSMVDMVLDMEHKQADSDTGMPKDRSMARRNVLRGQSSLSEGDREEGEEGGERDHSIQLLARSNTVSAFLREPLLEEAS